MSDKKVDGIRKLSKEEIRKSRKIVLDTIGEEINLANASPENMRAEMDAREKEKPALAPPAQAAKKVDGIGPSLNIKPDKAAEEKKDNPVSPTPANDPEAEREKKAEEAMSAAEKEKIRKWREKAKKVLSFDTQDDVREKDESQPQAKMAAGDSVRPARRGFDRKIVKQPPVKERTVNKEMPADKRPVKPLREGVHSSEHADAALPQKPPQKGRGIMGFIMKNYTEEKERSNLAGERKKSAEMARIEEDKRKREKKIEETQAAEEQRLRAKREAHEREIEKERLSVLREQERKRAFKEKAERKSRRRQMAAEAKRKIIGLPGAMRRKFHPRKRFLRLFRQTKMAAKRALYMFAIILLSSVFLYALWLVVVLKLDLNMPVTKAIAAYIPTPAIITPYGIINYNDYNAIRADTLSGGNGSFTDAEMKLFIARMIVVKNLAQKYNLSFNVIESGGKIDDRIKNELAQKIIYDDSVNAVGINRIKKIKELIDKNGDFVRTANTYGDEQGQVDINAANRNSLSYAADVAGLNEGDVSKIIFAPEGYYIFKCYAKTATDSALSYVFVRAKTLDKYIDETVATMKIWSLID